MQQPWEHPDWYDLHDTTWTAGPEREPEHYRELVLALPPLDRDDHLIDAGAGTGKLACMIARSYPRLGRVTLIEPNAEKLARAKARVSQIAPHAEVQALRLGLGEGRKLPRHIGTVDRGERAVAHHGVEGWVARRWPALAANLAQGPSGHARAGRVLVRSGNAESPVGQGRYEGSRPPPVPDRTRGGNRPSRIRRHRMRVSIP